MKARYRRLVEKRNRLCDQLQVMEMADGWQTMLASPLNQEYERIDAACKRMEIKMKNSQSPIGPSDCLSAVHLLKWLDRNGYCISRRAE